MQDAEGRAPETEDEVPSTRQEDTKELQEYEAMEIPEHWLPLPLLIVSLSLKVGCTCLSCVRGQTSASCLLPKQSVTTLKGLAHLLYLI